MPYNECLVWIIEDARSFVITNIYCFPTCLLYSSAIVAGTGEQKVVTAKINRLFSSEALQQSLAFIKTNYIAVMQFLLFHMLQADCVKRLPLLTGME